ncbi:MAG: deoxyribose-phosphate aldolase [Desulfuromonas sp.]|nr:MAG: deoxyribose-phosphate aldolase [Desulfuromonas sp.]
MPTTGPEDIHPASFIDHTLLTPVATPDQISQLCEEAVEYGFAAICIPPTFVRAAAEKLYGSEVGIATVVGFPLGYEMSAVKAFQTQRAVASGASEIDMVINLGAAVAGDLDQVGRDIAAVVAAAEDAVVKVILECCLFAEDMKATLARIAVENGAAYVKTSTGFSSGGATIADVRQLADTVAGRAGVKAAGGIRDWSTCRSMIEAGATRIGTSAGVAIIKGWQDARSHGS